MTIATVTGPAARLRTEEPASRPDRARIRARIGGLHCSLCTGTIEKALSRKAGVDKVAVSLTHEQVLVEHDPARIGPDGLLQTLRDIGHTLHDPRKLRPFEEEERELVRKGRRFLVALTFSLVAVALIATATGIGAIVLPLVAALGLIAFVFLVLRAQGLWIASSGAVGLGVLAGTLLLCREPLGLAPATPWLVGALAIVLVFGVARHVFHMAVRALRRGLLNQHVLLEAGAFAGLAGGLIGLVFDPPDYPTAPFLAVAVMVATYHLFSEWLALIVRRAARRR
jgi:Cu+-exporting ATPase